MKIINIILPVIIAILSLLIVGPSILWLALKLAKEESGRLGKFIKWNVVILILVIAIWGIGNIISRV